MGVSRIAVDRVRSVGRAWQFHPDALCGRCGDGQAAVFPDAALAPCFLGRALAVGDIRAQSIREIMASDGWTVAMGLVPERHTAICDPNSDSNDSQPAETAACAPRC